MGAITACPRCGANDETESRLAGLASDRLRCGSCGHEIELTAHPDAQQLVEESAALNAELTSPLHDPPVAIAARAALGLQYDGPFAEGSVTRGAFPPKPESDPWPMRLAMIAIGLLVVLVAALTATLLWN